MIASKILIGIMDMEKKHTFLSHTNIFKMNNSAAEQVIMGALSPK
jgi:hypothetical protein